MKTLFIAIFLLSTTSQAATLVDKNCNAYVENYKEFAAINLDRYSDAVIDPKEVSNEKSNWGSLPFQTGSTVLQNQGFKLSSNGKWKESQYVVKWKTYKKLFGLFGEGFKISVYQMKDGQSSLIAVHQDSNNAQGIRNAIESLPTCVTQEELSRREKFFEEDSGSVAAEKIFKLGDES